MAEPGRKPMLEVKGLQVYYGQSHAVQGVDLKVGREVLAVVGRNGMGKTTLCNAIMGLVPSASGSIRVEGREVRGLRPDKIAAEGVGYVPQGRRVWPSLSVDEHLKLAFRKRRDSAWTIDRVYQTFPRLAERRGNGGAQLSGGEQQMLAIARALLGNPKLLVLDEPTEGLAPAIVEQVEQVMRRLVEEEFLSVLLIEQNIGVACEVSEEVAIIVNGRITRLMPASQLAADTGLQQSLLGVGRHRDEEIEAETDETPKSPAIGAPGPVSPPSVFSVVRRDARVARSARGEDAAPSYRTAPAVLNRFGVATGGRIQPERFPVAPAEPVRTVEAIPRHDLGRTAYVVGTFDTKADELNYIAKAIRADGVAVRTVDVSTSGKLSTANVSPREVASAYRGAGTVFRADRGQSITAMAEAFRAWIVRQRDLGGIISAGGSGGTSLVTPGMQALPVGVPKIVISTVASGDVARYVGPVDIMMMYSVVDIQGINSISADILRNGAHALAGMIAMAPDQAERRRARSEARPALGITMFGLTTPCVQAVTRALSDRYECLVFHATGTGGRSMEHLADSGVLAGVIDVTTTEIADMLMGGVFAANEDRFGGIIRSGLPYVGSLGALDMVNFGAMETLPERYRGRLVHVHNPQVTLMRTTRDENVRMGRWIAQRFSLMTGPTRILIPTGGLSGLDAPGQPFHDPDADAALFEAIETGLAAGGNRRLIRVPAHINDPAFSAALVEAYQEISGDSRKRA